jgi:hypothetical protein
MDPESKAWQVSKDLPRLKEKGLGNPREEEAGKRLDRMEEMNEKRLLKL